MYDRTNVFAKILRGEIPCQRVHEDEHTLAFMDVMPQSDGHVLVLPKYEARNLLELPTEHLAPLMTAVQRIARAAQQAFNAQGIALMQFNGEAAGQSVFHVHLHVVPRYAGIPLRPHSGTMADQALLAQQAETLRAALNTR